MKDEVKETKALLIQPKTVLRSIKYSTNLLYTLFHYQLVVIFRDVSTLEEWLQGKFHFVNYLLMSLEACYSLIKRRNKTTLIGITCLTHKVKNGTDPLKSEIPLLFWVHSKITELMGTVPIFHRSVRTIFLPVV